MIGNELRDAARRGAAPRLTGRRGEAGPAPRTDGLLAEGGRSSPSVTLVIPTYGRDEVLLRTLGHLLELSPRADEIVVVDQTREHDRATRERLGQLDRQGAIRWVRLEAPSIPHAMNVGLLEARSDRVLYLDDDIEPAGDLVGAHARAAQAGGPAVIVAGQVLQPGETPADLRGADFAFRSSVAQQIEDVMGGNFSVARRFALAIGGFDESFVGAAYRFEADFSRRALAAGASIRFEPGASIRHLRAERGGTRRYGSHLETLRPFHSVGEYYYLLRHRPAGWVGAALQRPLRAVLTRHHLRRPWWIPVTLFAETSGLALALRLACARPRLLALGGPGAGGAGAPGGHGP